MFNLSRRPSAPGPRGHLLFGHLRSFEQDPVQSLLAAASEFGDVVGLRWGWIPIYLLSKPQHVQHVLQGNSRNYRKRLGYARMRPLLGMGILVSEGDYWLRHRRLIQPALHHQRIGEFGRVISEATLAMLDRWGAYATAGQPFDVAAEMMRLSNHVIGRIVFGADFVEDQPLERALALAAQIGEEMTVANTHNLISLLNGLGILPSDQRRRIRQGLGEVDAALYRLIAERRRSGEDRGDLLSMLVLARDEQGALCLDDTQVRDEALTILLAGNKTTGVALAWVWYLLSQHPDVERRLHAELESVLGGRTATVGDLPNLPYTRMVIHESLRLYPPIWMTLRTVAADDMVGGWRIPAGAGVIVSPYVTQRLPSVWDDPQTFDPERFAPERAVGRPHFSYFPFGGGPRQCIGKELALVEAQLMVALVAQRYRLSLTPGHPIALEPTVSLRPRYGVRVTLIDRAVPTFPPYDA